jgi:hypothetical protein
MKKLILLTTLALVTTSLAGCSTCRQMTSGWFNRGDRCETYPPADCAPGVPRATMMLPSTQQVLPGQIEIAPQG